jgi:hypothetical protein
MRRGARIFDPTQAAPGDVEAVPPTLKAACINDMIDSHAQVLGPIQDSGTAKTGRAG